MLKKTLFLVIYLALISTTALAQGDKVDSAGMKVLRIDPSRAKGVAVSQVFDEVKFIPLETNGESLFGTISQLSVTEHNFILYDYDTKAVLIFDKAGKYIAKVNSSKIEKGDKVTEDDELGRTILHKRL